MGVACLLYLLQDCEGETVALREGLEALLR